MAIFWWLMKWCEEKLTPQSLGTTFISVALLQMGHPLNSSSSFSLQTGVGKCSNVSHHPTIGDSSSPTDIWRWCSKGDFANPWQTWHSPTWDHMGQRFASFFTTVNPSRGLYFHPWAPSYLEIQGPCRVAWEHRGKNMRKTMGKKHEEHPLVYNLMLPLKRPKPLTYIVHGLRRTHFHHSIHRSNPIDRLLESHEW